MYKYLYLITYTHFFTEENKVKEIDIKDRQNRVKRYFKNYFILKR